MNWPSVELSFPKVRSRIQYIKRVMKFLLMLFLSFSSLAASEMDEAKKSVEALIRPLLATSSSVPRPKGTEKFRVDNCKKHKVDWMAVLLRQSEATLDFTFKPGCDIEGVIKPLILTPFPASLKLRNLQSFDKVDTMNKVTALLETRPVLNLEMREGLLTGKKSKVKFEADYRVRVSPAGGKTVTENLGGEIRISEINGKKVQMKEKILVK